jgi:hypothetical protein
MIRVFPRKTKATPDDKDVYFDAPPRNIQGDLFFTPNETVYVSCTFTYDRPKAEWLAGKWREAGYDVKIGGPAYGDRGGEFVAGRFLKHGNIITSRGCNNNCWFCSVHEREGGIRELPIVEGWNVRDDNLLQCSDDHINAVFDMLKKQQNPIFSGGLEAKKLKQWHINRLSEINTARMYFAYDTPNDYKHLKTASEMLFGSGFKPHDRKCCCYCLCGYEGDTIEKAEERFQQIMGLGMTPFAMLYRDETGFTEKAWRVFQRLWASPIIIYARFPQKGTEE